MQMQTWLATLARIVDNVGHVNYLRAARLNANVSAVVVFPRGIQYSIVVIVVQIEIVIVVFNRPRAWQKNNNLFEKSAFP